MFSATKKSYIKFKQSTKNKKADKQINFFFISKQNRNKNNTTINEEKIKSEKEKTDGYSWS